MSTTMASRRVRLTVDGQSREFDADPTMPLVLALRDRLGLHGTKFSCLQGACGSCTVWLDGEPVRACQVPLGDAAGHAVTTIEGLAGPDAEALRKAWKTGNVAQCGWCQGGQLMHAAALLKGWRKQAPTGQVLRDALGAVTCRCGTGQRVADAVASVLRDGGAAA